MKKFAVRKTFIYEGKRYEVIADTETDAEIKKAMKLRDLQEGKIVVNKNMTVEQWADICLETYCRPCVKENTYKTYQVIMKSCILKHIGDMQIKDVKPITCQSVLNKQVGNSAYMIKRTTQMLHFIFGRAVKEKLILENPADDLTKPKGTITYRRSLTPREQETFLRAAEGTNRFNVFLLMYHCGCRPSEAKEALGRDISVKGGYPMLHIRGTKTKNADRLVPIPPELYGRIKATPAFYPIAPNEAGNKHTQNSYKRAWSSLMREMNIILGCKVYRNELIPPFPLADDLVPYCLRHTYCTNLQKMGVDIRTAQHLMGHADIQMTANIYTHVDDETILSAAEIISKCGTHHIKQA